jgi:hypothetical protein
MKTEKEREALELLLSLGYTDLYAFYYPLSQFRIFTRWQYYSTQQDQKIYRIDLIILPTPSLPYVTTVRKPYRALLDSLDHAPVSVTLNLTWLFRKSKYVDNVYTPGGERGEEGSESLMQMRLKVRCRHGWSVCIYTIVHFLSRFFFNTSLMSNNIFHLL